MLPVHIIRDEKEQVLRSLKIRGFKDLTIIDRILKQDDLRREIQQQRDEKKSEMNSLSKEIGQLYKAGKRDEAEKSKKKTSKLKGAIQQLDTQYKELEEELNGLLLEIPNKAHESVPEGHSDTDNEVHKAWEQPLPQMGTSALDHKDLAEKYNIIDFETGAKVSGAGFPIYRGKGARLQRALVNFFLDEAEKAGFLEHLPPHLVNEDSARGTGQLPDKEGQMYHIPADNLYLIPTAEVPLTNIYRDVILEEDDFPVKLCGYTPCFRREAGSYGKDVRGLNRLHQFDKVEIVCIEHPERSYTTLETMCAHVEGLLQQLGLPYRILRLCAGDIGFTAALTFDFETYSAAQQRWLEVSSVSNFEVFQATRLQLRYRPNEGKGTQTAHTLNGSALALPRIVATLLENNQTKEGIVIPEVLRPYTGFDMIS